MALTSDQITAQNFADFYQTILPYLNGGGFKMTKLWENSDPTQSFSAQTVILSSSDYDLLVMRCVWSTQSNNKPVAPPIIVKSGETFRMMSPNGGGTSTYTREGSVSGTNVTFNSVSDNAYIIPIDIYGIKLYAYDNISCVMMSSTWEAGETTVEFTDPIIDGDSIFDVYLPSQYADLIYSSLSVSGHTLTITFPSAQASDIEVKLRVNRG